MNETYLKVRQAVLEKKQVYATYRGFKRELCPHVLGTKGNSTQGLFYQFGGGSSTGLEPDGSGANWRCMLIDELTDVSVVDGEWHTAANHSRPQTCVDEIDVQVDIKSGVTEKATPKR